MHRKIINIFGDRTPTDVYVGKIPAINIEINIKNIDICNDNLRA